MLIIRRCEVCGKSFDNKYGTGSKFQCITEFEKRKFCSRWCSSAHRRTPFPLCKRCGAQAGRGQTFCSQLCYTQNKVETGKTTPCEHCCAMFHAREQKYKFCSHQCYWEHTAISNRLTDPPPSIHGCHWIPLGAERFALVEECDLDMVSAYTWGASGNGYVMSTDKVLLHRLLMGHPDSDVDHVNGDPLDNRRANLRLATDSQNLMNS